MSDIQNPERLKVPLRDKDGYFYPLTSYNQIIMPDGVSRWDGKSSGSDIKTVNNIEADENGNIEISAASVGAVFVDRTDAITGETAKVNADTLGGVPAEDYALKSDIPEVSQPDECKLPAGGNAGQILSKASDDDHDVKWSDAPECNISWEQIHDKPEKFEPTTHSHGVTEVTGVIAEEWTFTLEDGSTVTKKVLICD